MRRFLEVGGGGGGGGVVEGIEDAGQAEAAAQELLLDDGRPHCYLVIAHLGAGGEVVVDAGGDGEGLACPVVDGAGALGLGSLGSEAVELLAPLGVGPRVAAVHQRAVPDGVEVSVALEETHLDAVAAQVAQVAHVHGLMQVADEVDENLQRQLLLRQRRHAIGKDGDHLARTGDDVALIVEGCILVSHVGIDILIVPRLGVGIVGRVRGIVEPVGPIDGRAAFQQAADRVGSGSRQMMFGNIGHHIVALLAPGRSRCHTRGHEGRQGYSS